MKDFTYIAICSENTIKIGRTRRSSVYFRIKENCTSNSNFELHSYFTADISERLETFIHNIPEIKERQIRTNSSRETFGFKPSEIEELVKLIKTRLNECKKSFIYNLDNIEPIRIAEEYPYTLRCYQEDILEKMKNIEKGKIILATGLGKSVIFNKYIYDIILGNTEDTEEIKNNENTKIIVLCNSINLCMELCKKMRQIYSASYVYSSAINTHSISIKQVREFTENIVLFTTYHSSEKFLDISWHTAIYDECHRVVINSGEESMFNIFLRESKSEKHFFFTATEKMIGGDKEMTMDNVEKFGETLYKMDIRMGIDAGFLNNYTVEVRLTNSKILSLKKILHTLPKNSKVIVYFPNTTILEKVRNMIPIEILACHSRIKDSNKQIERFYKNECNVIFTCKMLTEGFDDKYVDTVIHYQVSKSPIETTQKNGRCLRTFNGKNESRIIFLAKHSENIEYTLPNIFAQMSISDPLIKKALALTARGGHIKIFNDDEEITDSTELENYIEIVNVFDRFFNKIDKNSTVSFELELISEFYKEFNEYPFSYRTMTEKEVKSFGKKHSMQIYPIPKFSKLYRCPYPYPYNMLKNAPEEMSSGATKIVWKILNNKEYSKKRAEKHKYKEYRDLICDFLEEHLCLNIRNSSTNPMEKKQRKLLMFCTDPNVETIQECFFKFTRSEKYYSHSELWNMMKKNGNISH